MRVVGYTEAASFLARHPLHGEALTAWLHEVRHRHWRSPAALAADFGCVEVAPPYTIFRLGIRPLLVETIVDFRNQVVLLTGVRVTSEAATPSTNHD